MVKTYKTLYKYNFSDIYAFTATDAEILKNEQTINRKTQKIIKLVNDPEFCALRVKTTGAGAYILHKSTRPGVKFQLSIIAADGIPTAHENIKDDKKLRSDIEYYFLNRLFTGPVKLEILTA